MGGSEEGDESHRPGAVPTHGFVRLHLLGKFPGASRGCSWTDGSPSYHALVPGYSLRGQ